MTLTPFSSTAGLNDDDAVWPLTTASASVTVRVTVGGRRTAIGAPSTSATMSSMPSTRKTPASPAIPRSTANWSKVSVSISVSRSPSV